MAGIPSAVGSHRRWSTTHGKTPFTLSGPQMQMTSDNKAATESSGKPNWETATGLMPRFASFAARDWETHGGGGGGNTVRHPYASAGGEESFLSVNEKTDKDTEAELPAFVSYVPIPYIQYPNTLPRAVPVDSNFYLFMCSLAPQLRLSPRARGRKQARCALPVRLAPAEQARREGRGHRDAGEHIAHRQPVLGPRHIERHRAAQCRRRCLISGGTDRLSKWSVPVLPIADLNPVLSSTVLTVINGRARLAFVLC